MDKVSASLAKQNFGQVLQRAGVGPVAIERHGKLVATLVPPGWTPGSSALDERRLARQQQQRVELERLLAHQRIGIQILGRKEHRKRLLATARAEVKRWAELRLCSDDYISRWSDWLALPDIDLVERMCSDADGWGVAMRQNSPFAVAKP